MCMNKFFFAGEWKRTMKSISFQKRHLEIRQCLQLPQVIMQLVLDHLVHEFVPTNIFHLSRHAVFCDVVENDSYQVYWIKNNTNILTLYRDSDTATTPIPSWLSNVQRINRKWSLIECSGSYWQWDGENKLFLDQWGAACVWNEIVYFTIYDGLHTYDVNRSESRIIAYGIRTLKRIGRHLMVGDGVYNWLMGTDIPKEKCCYIYEWENRVIVIHSNYLHDKQTNKIYEVDVLNGLIALEYMIWIGTYIFDLRDMSVSRTDVPSSCFRAGQKYMWDVMDNDVRIYH